GPGRFLLLVVSGLAGAALVWRRPAALVPAAGLSLVLFLLLTSAFAMQYLTWAVAAAYLVDMLAATAYNVAASVFVLVVCEHWNHAPPWHWSDAWSLPFPSHELVLMAITWVLLAGVAFAGLRWFRRPSRAPAVAAAAGQPRTIVRFS